MKTETIRYDLNIATHRFGITEHPQKNVNFLGMDILAFEGVPIADCIFMEVTNVPEVLPPWIERSDYKITTK